MQMHHNFLFDLDQTLLDFHASEYKALGIVLKSTGLDKYIDYLFISEEMGVTKPDAAFFDICLERIAEPKSSCIMIGDSLSSDMLGAKIASIDSVWFMPAGNIEEVMSKYNIKYTAASFDELYSVLEKWAGDAS